VHRRRRAETATQFVTNKFSENNGDLFNHRLAPVPEAVTPDFSPRHDQPVLRPAFVQPTWC
jgi:hypothetical protein